MPYSPESTGYASPVAESLDDLLLFSSQSQAKETEVDLNDQTSIEAAEDPKNNNNNGTRPHQIESEPQQISSLCRSLTDSAITIKAEISTPIPPTRKIQAVISELTSSDAKKHNESQIPTKKTPPPLPPKPMVILNQRVLILAFS